ncbi:MAG TPA: PIG-L family deacetylase [Chitinophagaceae bacterium]|nr:PIG-L family deacetylase [Chitinophagaceae bacterium]
MKKLILGVITLCQLSQVVGQSLQNWTSADMYQAIRKLNVLGSVLYVAAHPDDDNARLIAYFSKETLYRTAYLSLTRGDGGQNLIGDEQGFELGLIRTQELLASRKVDGGEQFFSRAYDFGYSKGPDETFTKWDKEKMLSDVVWVIRKFQPDIVITRFPTTGEGGHGHHTASAILANEAYDAAADPNRFPEQLIYVKPWQVKRVMWNSFGGNNQTNTDVFSLDDGIYNPLLGKSYGEIGAESRSQNKTQGTGSTSVIGQANEFFRTTKGGAPAKDLMDGVDVTWKRVKGAEEIEKIVADLTNSFDFLHPVNSVKGLVKLYQALQQLPDGYWKAQKIKETKQLIEQCSGLFITATSPQQFAVQSDSVRINFLVNNRLGVNIALKKVQMDAFDSSFNQALAKNVNMNFGKTLSVPDSKPITQPYWLANKMEEGYFNVNDQLKIGQADIDPAYIATVTLNIEGQDIDFEKPVKYKFTDPVRGETYWPVVVIPSYSLRVLPELVLINNSGSSEKFKSHYEMIFTSYKTNNLVWPTDDHFLKDTSKNNKPATKLTMNKETKMIPVDARYDVPPGYDPKDPAKAMIDLPNETYNFFDWVTKRPLHDLLKITYDHIPSIVYFKPAKVDIKDVRCSIYNKKIGYIVGAGDKIPEILEQMGYEVNRLNEKEISRNDLSKFDAIIAGVRAYNTIDWLPKYADKINTYVENGGNFIVQYNNTQFRNNQQPRIGPYNFTISGKRVTDENATVNFLKPDHPVMNFPNKITQEDFKNWIQERSIYHASNFDRNNFETIFSMHDPGEADDDGSLIIAKYGKGVFVYTGLVFFRELPAGIPGAYRLLANIIALNRKKAF